MALNQSQVFLASCGASLWAFDSDGTHAQIEWLSCFRSFSSGWRTGGGEGSDRGAEQLHLPGVSPQIPAGADPVVHPESRIRAQGGGQRVRPHTLILTLPLLKHKLLLSLQVFSSLLLHLWASEHLVLALPAFTVPEGLRRLHPRSRGEDAGGQTSPLPLYVTYFKVSDSVSSTHLELISFCLCRKSLCSRSKRLTSDEQKVASLVELWVIWEHSKAF